MAKTPGPNTSVANRIKWLAEQLTGERKKNAAEGLEIVEDFLGHLTEVVSSIDTVTILYDNTGKVFKISSSATFSDLTYVEAAERGLQTALGLLAKRKENILKELALSIKKEE